jgi:hypothetical protein
MTIETDIAIARDFAAIHQRRAAKPSPAGSTALTLAALIAQSVCSAIVLRRIFLSAKASAFLRYLRAYFASM